MEKRTPHCKLTLVKALITDCKVKTTKTTRESAAALGFDFDDMIDVVMALTPANFFKSMTPPMPITNYGKTCIPAHHDSWQNILKTDRH